MRGDKGQRKGDLLLDSTWGVLNVYIMKDNPPKIVLAPPELGFRSGTILPSISRPSRDQKSTCYWRHRTEKALHPTTPCQVNTKIYSTRSFQLLPVVFSQPSLLASLHDAILSIHAERRHFLSVNFVPTQRSSGPVPR